MIPLHFGITLFCLNTVLTSASNVCPLSLLDAFLNIPQALLGTARTGFNKFCCIGEGEASERGKVV